MMEWRDWFCCGLKGLGKVGGGEGGRGISDKGMGKGKDYKYDHFVGENRV